MVTDFIFIAPFTQDLTRVCYYVLRLGPHSEDCGQKHPEAQWQSGI